MNKRDYTGICSKILLQKIIQHRGNEKSLEDKDYQTESKNTDNKL